MTSMIGFAIRLWQAFSPPAATKSNDPLKFGVLGAANIAPLALIIPAKSHPEVVVQAIAARDRRKAETFAKKHGIPEVKDSYQEILDDPDIQCVFIPLPNSFHYEWAVRAIRAGKHVLVEKPAVSNAAEAKVLFRLPELSGPNAPVVLEALHYRFHPVWALFRSFITPADVVHTQVVTISPGVPKTDIRFNYSLSGGAMMDIGTYCFSVLRQVFEAEPVECLSCELQAYTDGPQKNCDYAADARFRFPNGGVGEARASLKGPLFPRSLNLPTVTVTHREVPVADDKLPASKEKFRTREVRLWNYLASTLYHRLDIEDIFVIRHKDDGRVVEKWTEKSFRKAYTFKEAGIDCTSGETYWMSYRYQLEQFVNRVRARKTTAWVGGEDSINQMKMIDLAYEKSGLGLRQTSTFR